MPAPPDGPSATDAPAVPTDPDIGERKMERIECDAREHDPQARPSIRTHKLLSISEMLRVAGAIDLTVGLVHSADKKDRDAAIAVLKTMVKCLSWLRDISADRS